MRRRLVHLACLVALQQPGAALQGPLRRLAPTVSVTDKPLPVDTPRGDIVLAAEPTIAVEAAEPTIAVETTPASYARGLATIGGIRSSSRRTAPCCTATAEITRRPCSECGLRGAGARGPPRVRTVAAPLAPTAADAPRADAEAWRAAAGGSVEVPGRDGEAGLSLTSSDRGVLIQLTALIVRWCRARGVPIPPRIWAVVLALTGVFVFTLDPAPAATGPREGRFALRAGRHLYATYDLRLFERFESRSFHTDHDEDRQAALVAPRRGVVGRPQLDEFDGDLWPVAAAASWSGGFVNAFGSVLQVSGQQAVGPARAQVVYASQPLWAAILSLIFLGETVGVEGCVGGALFIAACFLAATAPEPDPNCGVENCEV